MNKQRLSGAGLGVPTACLVFARRSPQRRSVFRQRDRTDPRLMTGERANRLSRIGVEQDGLFGLPAGRGCQGQVVFRQSQRTAERMDSRNHADWLSSREIPNLNRSRTDRRDLSIVGPEQDRSRRTAAGRQLRQFIARRRAPQLQRLTRRQNLGSVGRERDRMHMSVVSGETSGHLSGRHIPDAAITLWSGGCQAPTIGRQSEVHDCGLVTNKPRRVGRSSQRWGRSTHHRSRFPRWFAVGLRFRRCGRLVVFRDVSRAPRIAGRVRLIVGFGIGRVFNLSLIVRWLQQCFQPWEKATIHQPPNPASETA